MSRNKDHRKYRKDSDLRESKRLRSDRPTWPFRKLTNPRKARPSKI